jgi:hypothetical protein
MRIDPGLDVRYDDVRGVLRVVPFFPLARLGEVSWEFFSMPITYVDVVTIQPWVALLFGILILLMPRLLNNLVAVYLILIGVIGLWPHLVRTVT